MKTSTLLPLALIAVAGVAIAAASAGPSAILTNPDRERKVSMLQGRTYRIVMRAEVNMEMDPQAVAQGLTLAGMKDVLVLPGPPMTITYTQVAVRDATFILNKPIDLSPSGMKLGKFTLLQVKEIDASNTGAPPSDKPPVWPPPGLIFTSAGTGGTPRLLRKGVSYRFVAELEPAAGKQLDAKGIAEGLKLSGARDILIVAGPPMRMLYTLTATVDLTVYVGARVPLNWDNQLMGYMTLLEVREAEASA